MTPPKLPPRKKTPIDWGHIFALMFGWIFVIGASALLAYMIHKAPREGRLVCDPALRTRFTQVGTCHVEEYYR